MEGKKSQRKGLGWEDKTEHIGERRHSALQKFWEGGWGGFRDPGQGEGWVQWRKVCEGGWGQGLKSRGGGNSHCCSVIQLCPILCDPIDCGTPGFPVLQYLLEFAQIQVHWVSDAIQPPPPLSPLLYGPSLTSIHDLWKNQSFDYMDLCQKSDVSDF